MTSPLRGALRGEVGTSAPGEGATQRKRYLLANILICCTAPSPGPLRFAPRPDLSPEGRGQEATGRRSVNRAPCTSPSGVRTLPAAIEPP